MKRGSRVEESKSRSRMFFSEIDNFSQSDEGSVHQQEGKVKQLSREATKRVFFCRSLVFLIILGTCAAVSSTTYLYLRRAEDDRVQESYIQFTDSIYQMTSVQIDSFRIALSGIAEAVTAGAQLRDEDFPYVTLPSFEIPANNLRRQAGAEFIMYSPLVENETAWQEYATQNIGWVNLSRAFEGALGNFDDSHLHQEIQIAPYMWYLDSQLQVMKAPGPRYAPVWQTSPPPVVPGEFLNHDLFADHGSRRTVAALIEAKVTVMSPLIENLDLLARSAVEVESHNAFHERFVDGVGAGLSSFFQHPHAAIMEPIFQSFQDRTELVGFIFVLIGWDRFFANLLPPNVKGIYGVLENTCGQLHTYIIQGNKSRYIGEGDHHDRAYEGTKVVLQYGFTDRSALEGVQGHCQYFLNLYSSADFEAASQTKTAVAFAIAITAIFGILAVSFMGYDMFVRQRNAKIVQAASRADDMLASLFPTTIRDRLFADEIKQENIDAKNKRGLPAKSRLKNYLSDGQFSPKDNEEERNNVASIVFKTKPIADLFPETTIMFADIAGFTAWSSVREPSQVFTLLETLYHSFDEVARRRRVFKVETVGDCYVAVTGLPDPQKDHALIMCRFARECLLRARELTKNLEVVLGPDTAELAMRVGLHSGPVTAGVLRGERSRFQLFGDTMNTASRMESTGMRDRIQMSQETANLLIAAGKGDWVKPRADKVVAKGKGEMQTYFLHIESRSSDAGSSDLRSDGDDEERNRKVLESLDAGVLDNAAQIFDAKTTRLIDWNVDVLLRLLKLIVARRKAFPTSKESEDPPNEERFQQRSTPVIDEVKEIITLPTFNAKVIMNEDDPDDIELPDEVIEQLHDFVCNIAAIYRDNAFHNFEHASHVTMSVTKLLSRIVAPSDLDFDDERLSKSGKKKIASTLHDHTYGITSDPLTQFACVFSALIHDVDHTGVPNVQLVKENMRIASYYKGKSVAEQNSVDLAWDLLMDANYKNLRATIYHTDTELRRFRQLVVNSVMATDIVDKELKVLRNLRWDRAFTEGALAETDATEDRNRKATIVIEHLIQASDVAHTMQHWHIYRKWNERFFFECYEAYRNGRAQGDPAENWYFGELGFFDFYIIPLAKKLKDCGVFGVSSDEYLNYAIKNREEWEIRGREVVDEMLEKMNKTGSDHIATLVPKEPVRIHSPELKTSLAREA